MAHNGGERVVQRGWVVRLHVAAVDPAAARSGGLHHAVVGGGHGRLKQVEAGVEAGRGEAGGGLLLLLCVRLDGEAVPVQAGLALEIADDLSLFLDVVVEGAHIASLALLALALVALLSVSPLSHVHRRARSCTLRDDTISRTSSARIYISRLLCTLTRCWVSTLPLTFRSSVSDMAPGSRNAYLASF